MSGTPPRWVYRLLRTSLPAGSAGETILGDLHEEYQRRPAGLRREARYVASALRLAFGFRLDRLRRRAGFGGACDGLAQDLRHAGRGLLHQPSYSILAVLTLAVGIGASTAAFTIIYGALLQPLPYRDPDRLLRIYRWHKVFSPESFNSMSAANFRDLRARARGFDGMAGYQHWWFNLSAAGEDADEAPPLRVAGLRAEPALLPVLGVVPQLGRPLQHADAEPGAAPAVVIGDALWRSRFAADPGIVGRRIRIDLVARTVVGVLPASWAFLRQPQVIVPVSLREAEFHRGVRNIDGIARLAPGVSPDAGLAELQAIYADLEEQYPEVNSGWSVTGVLEQEFRVRRWRQQLWLLGGAVALVLLIACVNVAGLMLVRAEVRQHELRVRAALGAGRHRLARLFVLESLLVSLAGGLLGALVCRWLVDLALIVYAASIPRSEEVAVDARTVAFAIGAAVLGGLLVALAPVLQLRRGGLQRALHRGGRMSTSGAGGAATLRHALVVAEVALAVVLVAGAGLMIDSVRRLHDVELGVEPEGVLTFAFGLPDARYGTPAAMTDFWDRYLGEMAAIGGVEAVGVSTRQPLAGGTNGTMVLGGEPDVEPSAENLVEIRAVSPGYFEALGVPLLTGRMLGPQDRAPGGGVLVNEAFVRRRVGARDPLHEILHPTWLEQDWPIVGVVADTRDFGPTGDARPTAYWLVGAEPLGINAYLYTSLRTTGPARALLPQVRERLASLDADIPLVDVYTLEELAANTIGGNRRSALSLLSLFAGIALLLGAIGIYGVVSFSVGTRAREIGVRTALGATQGGVARLVLRQGLWMTALGVAAGLLVSLLTGRLLAGMLWEITPASPRVLLTVAGVLLATALLACWLPARRAARLPVVDALRND